MLTRINKHRDEAGFTLIELLVVVIIIGILAAIAIPVFLNQRNSARNASVQSDIRTLALEAESYYTTYQGYPGTVTNGPDTDPISVSSGNSFSYGTITTNVDGETVTSGFQVAGCNWESGVTYVYDSTAGGLQPADTDDNINFDCDTTKAPASDEVILYAAAPAQANDPA